MRVTILLMKYIFFFIAIFNQSLLLGQIDSTREYPDDDFRFFSDEIANNIRLYKVNSKVANEKKDVERAQFLFDSLVNHCLKGSFLDNFIVNDFRSSQPKYIEKFTNPIYLKTTATWCEPNDSEVLALNDVAQEFGDVIDFVVLYWDTRNNLALSEKNYGPNVSVVYVDELENTNSAIVHTLKHSLGLPTVFLMDENRKIIDVQKNISTTYTYPSPDEIVKYGEFNPGTTIEHFVKTYEVYFNDIIEDVNTILENL